MKYLKNSSIFLKKKMSEQKQNENKYLKPSHKEFIV